MTLTFPTLAERALAEFHSSKRKTSISDIARRYHAQRTFTWPSTITYTFDDDTSIITSGRGRTYTIRTELP